MNTNANMHAQIYDARKALGGYLERTDLLLARSGLSRRERDETLGQIAEQFYDLLGVPIDEADRELTENAIAQLAPETAFELNDPVTVGQRIRAVWQRVKIGSPVPVFLNDRGKKRVVWSELNKMLVLIALMMFILLVVTNLIMASSSWMWFFTGFMFVFIQVCIWLRFASLYHSMPVESMPRAEDWSATYLQKSRHAWLLITGGATLSIITLFSIINWLVSASLNRPAWPIDSEQFAIVSIALCLPLFPLVMLDALQRRRNTRRFQNWDRQEAPNAHSVDEGQPS